MFTRPGILYYSIQMVTGSHPGAKGIHVRKDGEPELRIDELLSTCFWDDPKMPIISFFGP